MATSAPVPTATDDDVCRHLALGELTVLARITDSSNNALLVKVMHEGRTQHAIHKPIRGERPLWDYPDGSLVARERAAYLLSHAGGFDIVPPTILRDGPFGPGSLQSWIGAVDVAADSGLVEVCPPGQAPPGWIVVLRGEDGVGRPVVLAHADDPGLRVMALFDAVINNSDRKGSHILRDAARLRGIDHGVSLSVEPKVRTVLWGFIGQPLSAGERARLERVAQAIDTDLREDLEDLLTTAEIRALSERIVGLLRTGAFPAPAPGWPAIPWPAL